MSQSPAGYAPYQPYQPPPSNGLGVAGFVVSITGLVACGGLLCPIGLLLSLIALTKAPRGFAVAGTVIGLVGSAVGVLLVLVITGVIGAGAGFFNMFSSQWQTQMTMNSVNWEIDQHYSNNNSTLPDVQTGNNLISQNYYTDDWGTMIQYKPLTATDYELISAGEDMAFGTADDITQRYTAYNYGSFGNTTNPFDTDENGGVSPEQIDFAFDAAAEQITADFGATGLPDESAGTQALSNAGLRGPWGMPMRYRPASPPWYKLESAGPDGVWSTEDDLVRTFHFAPSENP